MFIKLAVKNTLLKKLFVCSLLALVSACSSMSSTPRVSANSADRWAVLPINNLSVTAQADAQAQTLVETHLRARGVSSIDTYAPIRQVSLRDLLDPATEMNSAIEWAQRSGYRYGITGSVNEWHYKSGADKEPSVGMSLKLVDIYTRDVLWQGNASRTGWGYANLSAVADDVIRELLEEVQLRASTP